MKYKKAISVLCLIGSLNWVTAAPSLATDYIILNKNQAAKVLFDIEKCKKEEPLFKEKITLLEQTINLQEEKINKIESIKEEYKSQSEKFKKEYKETSNKLQDEIQSKPSRLTWFTIGSISTLILALIGSFTLK